MTLVHDPSKVPYLMDVKGFTEEEVGNDIFPVFTYTDFAFTCLAAPLSQVRQCTDRSTYAERVLVGGERNGSCFSH